MTEEINFEKIRPYYTGKKRLTFEIVKSFTPLERAVCELILSNVDRWAQRGFITGTVVTIIAVVIIQAVM